MSKAPWRMFVTGSKETEYIRADIYDAACDTNDSLRAENERLREALKEGADLIRGDAVGAEWKKGCAAFLRKARAALARQTEGEG